MERLRSVARAKGAPPGLLVQEAAAALSALGADHLALVTACRRLVERHPGVGPVLWLASRVLCAADPAAEAWRAADEIETDPTPRSLAAALPEEATAVLVGWPELAVDGLRRRGDVGVLVVSGSGESAGLSRRLAAGGGQVVDVEDSGTGAAVAAADLVVLEAGAVGPERFSAPRGSLAAAAVARATGVAVWLVAGVGRVLPEPLWASLELRLERSGEPAWERPDDVVPLDLCDVVVGPEGAAAAAGWPGSVPLPACPVADELLGWRP